MKRIIRFTYLLTFLSFMGCADLIDHEPNPSTNNNLEFGTVLECPKQQAIDGHYYCHDRGFVYHR